MKKIFAILAAVVLVFSISFVAWADTPVLMMATTTSTDNTGLLDELAPAFQEATGIELRWTSVGTGKALELGKNCDVDVLLVHAPDLEKAFVSEGYGVNRKEVMYNDFVIIGPPSDPADVKDMTVVEALKTIHSKKALFASRGDNSGTHAKELGLWKIAGINEPDKESWYIQTGQGMLNTINIAAERDAYTLTDRGTFIKYEANHDGNPPLVILVEGDESLFNQYSVIAINPKRCNNVKYDLAMKFIEWMTSEEAQKKIADFRLLGKQLFVPNAK
ncbi:MAG TPA: tungsten ABC transporter substrate-binding protein [Synergistaceae bacterium]|jgi:tungstate transport system substrate-binding protein|nr:MAG: ABC transporter, periplasmic substrate-binding protein [Synergistales bacterium 53_16]KUL04148.1 MAG: ABC transporter, periplasmic substrate-binding protein [Synergistales bacterium 54_9]HAA47387.1 tungsten ABC transporter substrate-binding protein [Synergistaceae bacterium]HAG22837.1 tungsten ABC transporter substrate-binding protein [Synergistaceae bacterium]